MYHFLLSGLWCLAPAGRPPPECHVFDAEVHSSAGEVNVGSIFTIFKWQQLGKGPILDGFCNSKNPRICQGA
jgi:hypothetical protein